MGRSSRVYIQLTNPSRSYFAGQMVEGQVVIQNDKPLKVKQVSVLLEGKAQVSWTEEESYTVYVSETSNGSTRSVPETKYRTVYYTSEEIYISQIIHLDGDGSNLTILKEGTINYPFRFILPVNLPSSFTSKIGLVSYFVEAELKRPILKPNIRSSLPFTVNGIFDLNLEPGTAQSQEMEKSKGSNFFACRKGKLGFALRLPQRSGFVPGEILNFHVEISNGSNKKVIGISASLKQYVTFSAQGKTYSYQKIFNEIRGPEVDKADHELWSPGNFVIPSLPPTRLGGTCRIIDVQYSLRVELHISGLSSSLTGKLPVMIGTIPFRSNFVDFHPGQSVPTSVHAIPISVQPQGPEMGFHVPNPAETNMPIDGPSTSGNVPFNSNVPSAPFFEEYPDLPPPSYTEAVGAESFDFSSKTSNRDRGDGQHNNKPGSSTTWKETEYINAGSPSAPTMDNFVPNYITYKL